MSNKHASYDYCVDYEKVSFHSVIHVTAIKQPDPINIVSIILFMRPDVVNREIPTDGEYMCSPFC
jgi:hypothetical protein